jgi:hypothetical protein
MHHTTAITSMGAFYQFCRALTMAVDEMARAHSTAAPRTSAEGLPTLAHRFQMPQHTTTPTAHHTHAQQASTCHPAASVHQLAGRAGSSWAPRVCFLNTTRNTSKLVGPGGMLLFLLRPCGMLPGLHGLAAATICCKCEHSYAADSHHHHHTGPVPPTAASRWQQSSLFLEPQRARFTNSAAP